jgi:hypothetical protein
MLAMTHSSHARFTSSLRARSAMYTIAVSMWLLSLPSSLRLPSMRASAPFVCSWYDGSRAPHEPLRGCGSASFRIAGWITTSSQALKEKMHPVGGIEELCASDEYLGRSINLTDHPELEHCPARASSSHCGHHAAFGRPIGVQRDSTS